MVSDDKELFYNSHNVKKQPILAHGRKEILSKFTTLPSSNKVHLYSAICTDCKDEVKTNFEPVEHKPFYCDFCQHHYRDLKKI